MFSSNMGIKYVVICSIFLIALISACGNAGENDDNPPIPTVTPNVSIEILSDLRQLAREIKIDVIPQPNCGGTAEVENQIQKSRSIAHTVEVGAGFSVNTNGQIGFAGTDIELGATIARELGYTYGSTEEIARSITVKAGIGTNMEHRVRLEEIWEVGTAEVIVHGQKIEIPFNFRTDFAVQLIESKDIGCPPTQEASSPASDPEIVVVTSEPEVIVVTATPSQPIIQPTTPKPICTGAVTLGPWPPVDGRGQDIYIESGDSIIHADFWSPSGPLKEGYDEVSVIIDPGVNVTIVDVAGQAWKYGSGCSKDYVEEQVAAHQDRRRQAGKSITTVSLSDLPIR